MKNTENRGIPNNDTSAATTVTERLLQIITERGSNPTKFYSKTGIGKGILDKKGGLTTNTMEKVIALYPDIDLFWLITGKKAPEVKDKVRQSDPAELLEAYRKVMELTKTIELKDEEIKALEEEVNIRNAKIYDLNNIIKDLENRLKTESKVG